MSNDYRENTVAQMIEDDQFNADLNRDNRNNPAFQGPYLSQPDYASKSTYAKFLFNRNEDANPFRQDSVADRQTANKVQL